MTQVSKDADFGPYHVAVVDLLNAASGLEARELLALAFYYEHYCTANTCEALNRVREAANQQSWTLVKYTLNGIMKVYISNGRCSQDVGREVLDRAQGTVYFAALAVMSQDFVSPNDYYLLTRPCRAAGIAQMLGLLEYKALATA